MYPAFDVEKKKEIYRQRVIRNSRAIFERVSWRYAGIVPSVVLNELAAMGLERRQVGITGIHNRRVMKFAARNILVRHFHEVEVRIVHHHIRQIIPSEAKTRGFSTIVRSREPSVPAAFDGFGPRKHPV